MENKEKETEVSTTGKSPTRRSTRTRKSVPSDARESGNNSSASRGRPELQGAEVQGPPTSDVGFNRLSDATETSTGTRSRRGDSSEPIKRSQRKTKTEPTIVKTGVIEIVDILRSGIDPTCLSDFCECAERLAELREVYKFTDQELLDTITYFSLKRPDKNRRKR